MLLKKIGDGVSFEKVRVPHEDLKHSPVASSLSVPAADDTACMR